MSIASAAFFATAIRAAIWRNIRSTAWSNAWRPRKRRQGLSSSHFGYSVWMLWAIVFTISLRNAWTHRRRGSDWQSFQSAPPTEQGRTDLCCGWYPFHWQQAAYGNTASCMPEIVIQVQICRSLREWVRPIGILGHITQATRRLLQAEIWRSYSVLHWC